MARVLYGIINSKFHGGGVVARAWTPRGAVKAMRREHDECFFGEGCQSYAVSYDNGTTWHPCDICRNDCTGDWELGYVSDIAIDSAANTQLAMSPAL